MIKVIKLNRVRAIFVSIDKRNENHESFYFQHLIMKKLTLLLSLLTGLILCVNGQMKISKNSFQQANQPIDTTDMTNNFYDNTETYQLPVKELTIEGEVANPGKVDFAKLKLHSEIVKEALLDSSGGDRFVGAYRYDGYSLFDILNNTILKKANSSEFNPIIDLYVEIENGSGEKVVFSWGEIYYPVNLNKILIATSVARIVPSKTKDLWPLPGSSKIIAASDLVTERNISNPVKITVKSVKKSFTVSRGMSPMIAPDMKLYDGEKQCGDITASFVGKNVTYNTIFYGRGRGIHSTSPFTGYLLKDVLGKYYPLTKQRLQNGMLCLVGLDGYRSAVSYSELFNRNDQQEFMLIKSAPGEDGGLFRIFSAADFFSDRAVKSVCGIYLLGN